jgi:hypothetical protein
MANKRKKTRQNKLKRRWKVALVVLGLIGLMIAIFGNPTHTTAQAAIWHSQFVTVTPGANQVTTASTATPTPTPAATATTTPDGQGLNASKTLTRIFQLDPAQYDSSQDENTWGMSACSAAAITEVINAYGFAYRIGDILHVEAQGGWITPDDGLTAEDGVEKTAALFGFQTQWGHNKSLQDLINIANAGQPVIASWPPATFPDGHIIVITGGDHNTVRIADSSRLNKTSVDRAQFSTWWGKNGFYAILTPPQNAIAGKPTITASFINQVLAHYGSPAQGNGQALYDLGQKYDIDPVYALAFFFHESHFGTTGMAQITHSLGNSRCVQDADCVNTSGGACQQGQSCYASYGGWEEGFEKWYIQMIAYENGALKYYLSKQWIPLTTVQMIIPTYAPSSDNNNEAAYIAAILQAVKTWRSGQIVV